ncbi:MAG: sulfotransferase family 2 domain-containing protein, partial [Pseudomonadota bacterium]
MGLCHVSRKHGLLVHLIAKNASSTLRGDVKRLDPDSESLRRELITDEHTFVRICALRDPVERCLSGYGEISLRAEMARKAGKSSFPAFTELPDNLARFEAFLASVEGGWQDAHIRPQATYVDENAADFWLRVETLEHDLRQVYRWLGVPTWTELPQRRSRDGRAADYSYDRFFLRPDELTPSLRDRVKQIYASDYALLRHVERRPRWSSLGNVRGPVRSSTGARPAVHPDQVGPEDAAHLLDAFAEENARRERVIVLRLGSRGFMAELTFLARA